ncbi:MAG: shikimate dehydrogenase family protein [Mycobacterium sp.]
MTQHHLPSGATRILGIIGDPIGQVLAPTVWSRLFRANGLDKVCIPMHVRPAELEHFLDGVRRWQNLDGLIVTLPHKIKAFELVAQATKRARLIGAVNSLRLNGEGEWIGDMLDGDGFVAAFEGKIRPVRGLRSLVVGSGGAGAAIAFALADGGANAVDVSDVDAARSHSLAERIAAHGTDSKPVPPRAKGYDLVVNASPAGMRPEDPLPVDLDGVTSEVAVADIVTKPASTRLLRAASALGCSVQDGLQMTEAQVALQAQFFGLALDAQTGSHTEVDV